MAKIEDYIAEWNAFVHDSGLPPLRLGFEIDYIPGFDSERIAAISQVESAFRNHAVPLNHLSASVHHIDGYAFFGQRLKEYVSEHSVAALIDKYFSIECEAASTGRYDFICHPGLVHFSLFSHGFVDVLREKANYDAYFNGFRKLVDMCAETGTLLEINTSGIDKYGDKDSFCHMHECGVDGFEVPNPNMPFSIMQYAVKKGAGFTVGSDWHSLRETPGSTLEAQRYFDQVYDALVLAGAKEVYNVVAKKKLPVPLEKV